MTENSQINSSDELPHHLRSLIESDEYHYAVESLSQFELPDFSDWPQPHLGIFYGWFLAGFRESGIDLEFFNYFADDVTTTSNKTVFLTIVMTPYERFWVNGSLACYFYLESPPLPRKKVCFGPSSQPFKLDTTSSKYDLEG